MRFPDRLQLARETYLRALGTVRASSTPRSWRRLLAAARNLRSAQRERAWPIHGERQGLERAIVRFPVLSNGATTRELGGAEGEPAPHVAEAATSPWASLERELERARRLVAEARQLCAESTFLRTAVRALADARITRAWGAGDASAAHVDPGT